MARKSIIGNLLDNYNSYIERIVITVLNSLLVVLLLNELNYQSFLEIVIPIIAIVSFVIPEIMAPIATLLFIVTKLYTLSSPLTTIDIINGFFLVLLGIIVPIIIETRYQSLQAFISAESVIGIPMTSYFLLAGIAEKRNAKINILSATPLLYLILNSIKTYTPPTLSQIELLILGTIMILIGAYLFAIKVPINLIGLIPSIIGIYILYYNTLNFTITDTITYISIVAVIVSGLNVTLNFLKENKAIREKRNEQISLINKEIDETLLVLGRIKSYAELEEKLGNVIAEEESNLLEVPKKLEKCKNFDCIKKEYEEFKQKKKQIEEKINTLIFNLIVDYNNAVSEIKKSGIIINEIQIPKEKIRLSETDIDQVQRILTEINKNTVFALNKINSIIEAIEKLTGIKLNRYYVTDYSLLPKAVTEIQKDNLINEIVNIVNLDREIIINLRLIGHEKEKIELSKKINYYYSKNLILADIPDVEKIANNSLNLVINYLDDSIKRLNKISENGKIASINEYVKFAKAIKEELNRDTPVKQKLEYLITYLPTITNIEDIIANEDAINALLTILRDNEELIKTKLYEEGCIKIEDLGINQKFAKYVAEYFSKDGLKLTIVQDKICSKSI